MNGNDRTRLREQMEVIYPPYDDYRKKAAGREIPVVVLDPVPGRRRRFRCALVERRVIAVAITRRPCGSKMTEGTAVDRGAEVRSDLADCHVRSRSQERPPLVLVYDLRLQNPV